MVPGIRVVLGVRPTQPSFMLPLEDAGKLVSPGPAGRPGLQCSAYPLCHSGRTNLGPAVQAQAWGTAEMAAIPLRLSPQAGATDSLTQWGGEPRATTVTLEEKLEGERKWHGPGKSSPELQKRRAGQSLAEVRLGGQASRAGGGALEDKGSL